MNRGGSRKAPRHWIGLAARNPLVRGGLTIGAGIVLGNIIGFVRVAVTAYLLGTHAAADALAVAIGPLDTLNGVLVNTMIFAFVPMLMLREGPRRLALFHQASRLFTRIFAAISLGVVMFAPWLISALGPGLAPEYFPVAVNILRLTAVSTLAAGCSAIQSALLFTERRFALPAMYQASLNAFTIAGALLLWRALGIYGFAIGYTAGAFVQFAMVRVAARNSRSQTIAAECATPWRELIAKPGTFLLYAGLVSLNVIVTRAYATHAGSGMAAAFEYCMRCVNVVIAYLVSPISSSLLPEIARLRTANRTRDAFRIIDKTISLAALAAVAGCLIGIVVRGPVIAILFQRGSFTAESTRLVADVFLGFAPSLIGLSLLELMSRSLFALDRPWLPVSAAAIPVIVNLAFTAAMHALNHDRFSAPQFIGVGASLGMLAGFVFLFVMAHVRRKHWIQDVEADREETLLPV